MNSGKFGDSYLHAANLLICAGTLATAAGPLAAGGAAVSAAFSWQGIAKSLRPDIAPLQKEIADLIEKRVNALDHPGGDVRVVLIQMIEAGLPDAQTIIDTGQQPEPLVNRIVDHLATLGQQDYVLPANVSALRRVLRPVFERLLLDADFTAQLAPLRDRVMFEIHEMARGFQGDVSDLKAGQNDMLALLKQIQAGASTQTIPIDDLRNLAQLFGLPADTDKSILISKLQEIAKKYWSLRADVDAIPESMRNLVKLKAAAQDAIDRVDLEEVETLIAQVHAEQLEETAKTAEIRADNALLRGRIEDAYRYLTAAADSFGGSDKLEPARKKLDYHERLFEYGQNSGGTGLAFAALMLGDALAPLDKSAEPDLWLSANLALGKTLAVAGERKGVHDGASLLEDALTTYCSAIGTLDRTKRPYDWAKAKNDIANVLSEQALHATGDKRASLYRKAVAAFRAALEVLSPERHPGLFAMIHTNLGLTWWRLGVDAIGDQRSDLYKKAADSSKIAVNILSRFGPHPLMEKALNNLGLAQMGQADCVSGIFAIYLLDKAIGNFEAVCKIWNPEDHPVPWALAQENIARAWVMISLQQQCTDRPAALKTALDAVDNAMRKFQSTNETAHHAKASILRDSILELSGLPESG